MPSINTVKAIEGRSFVLSEKIRDYRTACLAQAEYWAEGYCCRKEIVEGKDPHYNLWVGPERKRKVRTLPGEIITRQKSGRILGVA